ncbi:MAG: AEC family transporter [Pseudomonadota bacterium]
MSALSALITIVMPVFLLVGIGYVAVRRGVIVDAGVDALLGFATRIAVPVLLFRAIYRLDLATVLRPQHLASFYIAAAVCFALGIVLARLVWRRRPGVAVAIGFSALFSNSVLLGLPIMTRAYGEASLDPAFAIMAVHAPFCYLLGILTMEFARRDGASIGVALMRSAKAMFSNALALGIAAGFVANLSGIVLPGPVLAVVDMLSEAALPVALFALGGVLTRYALREEIGEALMISALSLIVHPGLAYLLSAQVFGMPEAFVRAAVVIAAMPPGVNCYVFAAMYDRAVGTAASTVLLATALSVLSVTGWLWFLGGAALG